MESSHSFNTKKNIANYVLIPLALVQSEIYWICSVLYYIFKESWVAIEEQKRIQERTRRRANSAPVRSISAPSPTFQQQEPQQQQQQLSVKFADKHTIESYNVNQPTKSLRRSSLPEISIRHRPSIHDERKGTTCPPLWWQKTRVKLGHTPVHGDPKPTMTSVVLDSHQKTTSVMINSSSIQAAVTAVHKTSLPPSPTSSSASTPISSTRPSFEQYPSGSSSSSIKSQESNILKQRDGTNASSASKKGPKFISKISAAFHKRSRSRD